MMWEIESECLETKQFSTKGILLGQVVIPEEERNKLKFATKALAANQRLEIDENILFQIIRRH